MTITQQADGTRALTPRVAAAGRVGQGTAIEQSRAVAEVEAAIVVALRHPRDIERAIAEMQRSCALASLAEKAFFRFSRGEGQISGPSVQLARELARCWGNFQSGLIELRRDDEYRQSEMQAWAWDVQTNTRTSTTFIVPHIRDTRSGPKDLTDVRDIYENNANMGARRLREMIFDSLPGWFTEDAVQACYRTLSGGEKDLPERIAKCVAGFAALGVTTAQLVRKLGSPAEKWTPYDLATLTVIYRSLQRGEISRDEEFGTAPLSAADVLAVQPAAAKAPAGPPAGPGTSGPQATEPAAAKAPAPKPGGSTGAGELGKLIARIPLGEAADIAAFIAWRAGRESPLSELTAGEVAAVTAYLNEALKVAGGDTTEAASAIWTEYRIDRGEDK